MPDPPVFEMYFVHGTTKATVQYSHVPAYALHGPVWNRTYIVSVGGVNQTTTDNSIVVSGPGGATLIVKVGIATLCNHRAEVTYTISIAQIC